MTTLFTLVAYLCLAGIAAFNGALFIARNGKLALTSPRASNVSVTSIRSKYATSRR